MPLQPRQQLRAVNGVVNPWHAGGAIPLRAVPDRNLHPLPDDEAARPVDENRAEDADADEVALECCLPSGCPHQKELILPSDPGDAVRVVCNNDGCTIGRWMHGDCFQQWEEHVLGYLRSCGRARSWSEKQRLQNLWTKKGYDLAFKACDCRCGKGHLRKDLNYLPLPKKTEDRRPKKRGRTRALTSPGAKVPAQLQHPATESSMVRAPLRVRTSSLCSTGSSPPSSDGTPPLTPGLVPLRSSGGRFDFFADAEQAAAGNIFWRRTDLSAFTSLPRHLQNPYQIKIEDEGPHGNDETRSFILTQLSGHKATVVHCAVCQVDLPVYDKYPLIDGTFFLSPHQYSVANITVTLDRRPRAFLNAICMRCLDGGGGGGGGFALRCLACKTPWSGATLVIGTMYAYDVFAALPCCSARLTCKVCHSQVLDPGTAYPFFSDYSRLVKCHSCGSEDYHFIKPLGSTFFRSPERLF